MSRPGPVIFLGTAPFAVPSLEALIAAGEAVALVVTQPDRPRGRGQRTEATPVKAAAERLGLRVAQPEQVNAPETLEELRGLAPELLVVVAYGQLLRRPLLDLARRGAVNLHPSLLPRHRGPSPVASAILAGDDLVGNTTMLLDEGMDSGPVLLQESMPLDPEATRGEVEEHLAGAGGVLLARTLRGLREGAVRPVPQDETRVTVSRLLTRQMRPIPWDRSAGEVRRLVHALSPHPGALTLLGGRLVKILRVREVEGAGPPGRVLELRREGPVVGCGAGSLLWLEVQPEGRRPMRGADFARGGGVAVGQVLEVPWDD
ncbi:MAG: methionyl-tRNA formyltransferase [Deferrisomatales bacterium]|nr:methionyl-tRNA formyltransferase [Deferrisomatales bacterium]